MKLKHTEPGAGLHEYRMPNGDPLHVQANVELVIDEDGARWLLSAYPAAFVALEESPADGN